MRMILHSTVRLTVLTRQSTAISGNIRIDALGLLLGKLRNVIPVLLQTVRDLVRRLGIAQLENRVVVHGPVLGLLISAPDLFSFYAEDLHADAARRWRVVRYELWGERGITHDAIIACGPGEHALGEMGWEVVADGELANNAL
jgi:hypothetical protein